MKPDPTLVLELIKNMGLEKEECVFVGDTSVDMITGKNAELYTIGVLWGFREKDELVENGADATASTAIDLYNEITYYNR